MFSYAKNDRYLLFVFFLVDIIIIIINTYLFVDLNIFYFFAIITNKFVCLFIPDRYWLHGILFYIYLCSEYLKHLPCLNSRHLWPGCRHSNITKKHYIVI